MLDRRASRRPAQPRPRFPPTKACPIASPKPLKAVLLALAFPAHAWPRTRYFEHGRAVSVEAHSHHQRRAGESLAGDLEELGCALITKLLHRAARVECYPRASLAGNRHKGGINFTALRIPISAYLSDPSSALNPRPFKGPSYCRLPTPQSSTHNHWLPK